MRVFSFVFHIFLTLVMVAMSFVALVGGQHTLQIRFLPWTGAALTYWLFFGGLVGLAVTLMAIKRVAPVLFVIWSVAVLVMVVRGYFFTGFNFGYTATTFSGALSLLVASLPLWMVIGSLVAAAGSAMRLQTRRAAVRRQTALV
jgi:hypothetical protein